MVAGKKNSILVKVMPIVSGFRMHWIYLELLNHVDIYGM